jgi:outer membrane immunogenic protein
MIRHLLLASGAGLVLTGAASAADLPRRAPPPVFVPVPVFTWTGAYFGINAGYITTDNNRIATAGLNTVAATNVAIGARPPLVRVDQDGFTVGGQVGYNYQFTPGAGVVIGVEADAAYTDLQRNTFVVGSTGALNGFRSSMDFLGTVRGRIGYAFDRTLVYGTGGFAYGDVTERALFFAPAGGGALQFAGNRSRIETGYAVGGGVEYALPTDSFLNFFKSSAVTVKAEALYYDLGRRNLGVLNTGLGPAANPGYVSRFENNGIVARAGINYKFGTF